MTPGESGHAPGERRARVAIDLGAESCRVSLLRWHGEKPEIELIHRISNGPVHRGTSLRWPLAEILSGLEEGLRKAAQAAPEGITSIAVDGWAVDYVRLDTNGVPLAEPHCYRDERTIASKEAADAVISPERLFAHIGAQPLRLNTMYQLLADPGSGIDPKAPWVCFPEYVLYWLGGRRVAEYTNATHTGLVDPRTGHWCDETFRQLGIPLDAAPPIVPAGTILGRVRGSLGELDAFRDTQLIAPACHDTASAIAGIATPLDCCAYICSGTWSLVGTLVPSPILKPEAMRARYTNQGAAAGGFCFHTNVNGMWTVKQCMDGWAAEGRAWSIEDLVREAAKVEAPLEILDVDAEPLLLDGHMPARINHELEQRGLPAIADTAGSEPLFARLIFESLACRYASAIANLEEMLGRKLDRIHVLGGGSRNKLLTELTARRTGLPVEAGEPESSTIGNFAVQLAAGEAGGRELDLARLRTRAARLCST
ncbi:MAG TPA: FGGY-family carbohydrate kinase [Terracidiphilus sp.]|nr:FGGY-family carbohydrate kinase [Terracidiphilus sp.]